MHLTISLSISIFACGQQSDWTSVCVSMHESWARIPSVIFLRKSYKLGNPRQVCPEVEYVVSGWRSVIAVLLRVGDGASLIRTCTYKTEHTPRLCIPWTVCPLNRTRLDKAHVHRRICRLVMYVCEVYAKGNATCSCGC